MTTKQERLKEVYNHLRSYFGIHTQIDFAEAIRITRPALSSAMNGNEAYLTKNLFQKICAAFPGVFNLEYLLTGKGILITPEEDAKTETIRIDHEQINKSIDVNSLVDKAVEIAVSSKNETINVLKSQMADLRIQLVEKDKTIEDKNRIIALLNQRVAELESVGTIRDNYPFPLGSAEPGSKELPRV